LIHPDGSSDGVNTIRNTWAESGRGIRPKGAVISRRGRKRKIDAYTTDWKGSSNCYLLLLLA
jgi:hypothetical protein